MSLAVRAGQGRSLQLPGLRDCEFIWVPDLFLSFPYSSFKISCQMLSFRQSLFLLLISGFELGSDPRFYFIDRGEDRPVPSMPISRASEGTGQGEICFPLTGPDWEAGTKLRAEAGTGLG